MDNKNVAAKKSEVIVSISLKVLDGTLKECGTIDVYGSDAVGAATAMRETCRILGLDLIVARVGGVSVNARVGGVNVN